MRIKPTCRVCGAPVQYMGDLCAEDADYEETELDRITRDDTRRLAERMGEE